MKNIFQFSLFKNLNTFEENYDLAKEIFANKNTDPINVWESGIMSLEDAQRAYDCGADALLIGQGLVQSENPAKFIGSCLIGLNIFLFYEYEPLVLDDPKGSLGAIDQ